MTAEVAAVVSAAVVLMAAVGCGGCPCWYWGVGKWWLRLHQKATVLCACSAGLSLISIIKRDS